MASGDHIDSTVLPAGSAVRDASLDAHSLAEQRTAPGELRWSASIIGQAKRTPFGPRSEKLPVFAATTNCSNITEAAWSAEAVALKGLGGPTGATWLGTCRPGPAQRVS